MSAQTVKVFIDGAEIEVPSDASVFHACEKAGKQPPHFCYHPALGVDGNCRMCMVKVEGLPKPQISCDLRVKDGMKVDTESEEVRRIRSGVLELILVNHPIDCPVCDQSGECSLQNYYMTAGLHKSYVPLEAKVHKPKVQDIGGDIMLDAERCVACSRCVRFCSNVTKTGELALFNRGDHTEIGLHPGVTLHSDYTGNLADVCPVGALTSKDFRFKCRVWFLSETESVCPGCATGCNIEVHVHEGEIQRLKPRVNDQVNGWWMCDPGRFGYHAVHAETRIPGFFERKGEDLVQTSREDAIAKVGRELKRILREAGAASIAGVASSKHTVEDLYAFKKLFEAIGAPPPALLPPAMGEGDDLLMHEDKTPNTTGAELLGYSRDGLEKLLKRAAEGGVRALVVLGADLSEAAGGFGKKAVDAAPLVVAVDTDRNPTVLAADFVLPAAAWAEIDGTFVTYKGRVQRIRPAVPAPDDAEPAWRLLQDLAALFADAPKAASPAELFLRVAEEFAPFGGMDYEAVGSLGKVVRG